MPNKIFGFLKKNSYPLWRPLTGSSQKQKKETILAPLILKPLTSCSLLCSCLYHSFGMINKNTKLCMFTTLNERRSHGDMDFLPLRILSKIVDWPQIVPMMCFLPELHLPGCRSSFASSVSSAFHMGAIA